jgi:hypothetical protein
MATVSFNGELQSIVSIEDFGSALDRFDQIAQFELWLSVPGGASIAMLRNGPHAFLMYLRFSGDAGFASRGEAEKSGETSYTLSNGQVDSYPLSWSIELDSCYQALAYFFVNDGAKPDWIKWAKS